MRSSSRVAVFIGGRRRCLAVCVLSVFLLVGMHLQSASAAIEHVTKDSAVKFKESSDVTKAAGQAAAEAMPTDGEEKRGAAESTESNGPSEATDMMYLRRHPGYWMLDSAWDDMGFWSRPTSSLLSRLHALSPFSTGNLFEDLLGGVREVTGINTLQNDIVGTAAVQVLSSNDSHVVYGVKLAGVPRENIDVSIDAKGVLNVEATYVEERRNDQKGSDGADTAASTARFKYLARRQLPFGVDADKVQAEYKDGLLRITVPKPPKDGVTTLKLS
mmetsp:Transcript_29253/g.82549  ORF Transcript_29253/g.82549 Transcript_29253/m.82549 type:complete len:273 (+) Transcript_29253:108-926(+)|eukprot:CAMPEP_0117667540 /NCGR_PEP_ID=MMETSP0804-20121206/11029_1 /TAXON_ID=1074897 /ORGANISM="Tetraselmis astigmatica, Strain CCMP880" /LENGTH=272 /DNA_ID=CAMNT_0005475289 /DNA_START=71 /DNA_END=889 /DNA_ORIENTATION=-